MKEIKVSFLIAFILILSFPFFAFSIQELKRKYDESSLPTLISGPPSTIDAVYNEEIPLKVTLSKETKQSHSSIVWILNDKKICSGYICFLKLNEEEYRNSNPILYVIVSNDFGGNTYSYDFKIHSSMEYDVTKSNKEVEYLVKNFVVSSASGNSGPSSLRVESTFGKGTLIQSNYILYIGKVPRSFQWKNGYFQTDNVDSIKISDSESGTWFLLPSTQLNLVESESLRIAELFYGNLRLKASGNQADATNENPELKFKGIVKTDEAEIRVLRGTDVLLTRELDANGQFFTKVVSIGGVVQIFPYLKDEKGNYKKDISEVVLGTGLEFTIYESGKVLPLGNPKKSVIDNFLAFTMTYQDLDHQAHEVHPNDLNDILERAKILEASEEYFELYQLILPYQQMVTKNALLSYFFGVAKKGLYQVEEAKQYFYLSKRIDAKAPEAYWQLALILIEEKKYYPALIELTSARQLTESDSKIAHEYEYYSGVSLYQINRLQEAKQALKIAVWDAKLDPSLRQSAADYLKKINVEKPWSLTVPVGIQYDGNMLSVAQNESLPTRYSDKAGYRSIIGGLFLFDKAKETEADGWFWGAGAKSFYVKNFPSDFNNLDAFVLEGSAYQTYRYQINKEKKESGFFKLYQTFGSILVDYSFDTEYLLFGINYKNMEFNTGLQIDVSNRSYVNQKSGLIYNQYYNMKFGDYGPVSVDLAMQGQELVMFNTTSAVGHSIELFATPAATYAFDSRTSLKGAVLFDFLYTFISPMQSSYKFIPSLTLNHFFLEWLIGSLSTSYEYTLKFPGSNAVLRPGLSLMITGLF